MSNAGSTKALARPWRGLSPGLSKAVPAAFARGLWLSAGRARGLWRGLRAGGIEKRRAHYSAQAAGATTAVAVAQKKETGPRWGGRSRA